MNNEITIQSSEAVQAMTTAELDVAIATAKRYPRNVQECLKSITEIATIDQDTAAECFYHLERDNKKTGTKTKIEGLSIRMAEIIATSWQNLRVASRIIDNDGKNITAQAIAFDTEKNVMICQEVKRSILTATGATFSQDMQTVHANAAQAIARRNAILSVVPKAVTASAIKQIKAIAVGHVKKEMAENPLQYLGNLIKIFGEKGITEAQLCEFIGVSNRNEIDADKYMVLRGVLVAIKEGDTTAKEAIIDELARRRNDAQVAEEIKATDDAVTRSMKKNAKGGKA